MKVGMIFECCVDGPDQKVCEYLAKQIVPGLEVSSRSLVNKKFLVEECGEIAAALLNEECEKVLIVWDLYPAWRQDRERPCRHEDKENIRLSLTNAEVDLEKVRMVCIEEELEAWLLADGRAVSKVLSTQIREVSVGDGKKPERIDKPKTRMMKLFQQNKREYADHIHAIKIAEALPDLKRIRRSKTFMYFAQKLTGNPEISF
jgi:uncharacterized protein DUF4276